MTVTQLASIMMLTSRESAGRILLRNTGRREASTRCKLRLSCVIGGAFADQLFWSQLIPLSSKSIPEADIEFCQTLATHLGRRSFNFPGGIRALVMDFDGVLTDDRVLVSEDGKESVLCSRGDGLGLGMLRQTDIQMLILSKERNGVVRARANKLQIEARNGIDDKLSVLNDWVRERGITLADTIFVGNDVNDLPCMLAVGWPIAPADAHPDVRKVARHVTTAKGGRGAIREIAELLLDRRA